MFTLPAPARRAPALAPLLAALVISASLAACASPTRIPEVAEPEVREIAIGEERTPVMFSRIVLGLNRGQQVGTWAIGLICIPRGQIYFRGRRDILDDEELGEVFREEFENANYDVAGDPDALFDDPDEWRAEILIAGRVTDLAINSCVPRADDGNRDSSADAFIEVEWQIYDRLRREVIHTTSTQGTGSVAEVRPGGTIDAVLDAFAHATRGLLADADFHALATGQEIAAAGAGEGPALQTLAVARSSRLAGRLERNMGRISDGVVTIFAGGGHGSGFVIDRNGLILTNEHVVRLAERVTLKTADGEEHIAEVLRRDSRRDVALLRVNGLGASPLPLVTSAPAVGSDVYAVGSPLHERFDTTVSRGIVSGLRERNGQTFIQSDVNIQPGSSGGPLLDAAGNVIGLTVSGVPGSGINFFIPVGDALEALAIRYGG